MKKNVFFFAALLLLVSLFGYAQEVNRCVSYEMQLYRALLNRQYGPAVQKTFDKATQVAQHNLLAKAGGDSILRIPVVVHIVYNTSMENIPDAAVYQQIDILNRDYRRQNADSSLTRDEFKPVAADAGIEFYLAQIDPDGNPTTGITRTQTSVQNFSPLSGIDIFEIINQILACGINPVDILTGAPLTPEQEACLNTVLASLGGFDAMKFADQGGKDAWPTDQYLNIWVCNMDDGSGVGTVLGFAYPPAEAPNWPAGSAGTAQTDGVAIHYPVFGGSANPALGTLASVVGEGRTCVHEVGHYLGLRHIWGDGDCTMDDGIADTPNSDSASQQECDYTKNSCMDTPVNYPDMIENYMDYSDEDCMNIFTHDQVGIMRAMLLGPRSSLLQGSQLAAPQCDFTSSATTVNTNELIQFTDLSTGGISEWYWAFGDGEGSTLKNPTHSYAAAGTYSVSLTVINALGNDFELKESYITVSDAVGIAPNTLQNQVQLSPNPTKGLLNLQLPASGQNYRITVMTTSGQQVYQTVANAAATLDLSAQPDGVYLISVTGNSQSITLKALLQR